ncbi:Protein of unknown function [Cotesia congregata]|uniref:Uncharacterized protein n=1 Tax=Cotesia congregata TaxID=51543 RepID=A0A8J2EAQ6_COTCN|nr:Protein of unknown function [Cotesia congregata]
MNFLDFSEACGHYFCKTYTYKPCIERYKFLSRLPNSQKLNTLVLIGTNSSLFYDESAKELQIQDLTIVQQLKYGVRVLDIGLRLLPNMLDTHSDSRLASGYFFDLLIATNDFLDLNPGELIIMLVRHIEIEPPKKDVTRSGCKILDFYIRHVEGGSRLVKNWRLNDTIGQHRGRILIGRLDYLFKGCVVDLSDKCKPATSTQLVDRQHDSSIDRKWNLISKIILDSFLNKHECLINDLSYYDGKNTRRAIAKDAGLYHHFSCDRPINDLVANEFLCPNEGLNIVVSDYMTQELGDKVNDCNFLNSSWRIGWE